MPDWLWVVVGVAVAVGLYIIADARRMRKRPHE